MHSSGSGVEKIHDWPSRLRSPNVEVRNQAIEELRKLIVRGLARSLSHRYGGRVDAEDIAQISMLKILESLDSFAGRSKFETWAMAIATRIGISELRRRYYRTVSLGALSDQDGFQFEVISQSDPESGEKEELQLVIQVLHRLIEETLSDRQRTVIRGVLTGLAIEVIAERLSSNRNAIYKLAHDARLKIKLGFEEAGISSNEILILLSKGI